jgi:hypothetical protein
VTGPVARLLSIQDNTDTGKASTDIHIQSGIRTQDPSVSADEDTTYIMPLDPEVNVLGYFNF